MKDYAFPVKLYIWVVTVTGFFLLTYLTFNLQLNESVVKGFLFFGIFVVFADSLPVKLPRGGSVSVSGAVVYASIILFNPAIPAYIMVLGTVLSKIILRDESPWYKLMFNCAQLIIAAGVSGLVYQALGGIAKVDSGNVIPFVIAGFAFYGINCTLFSLILYLSQNVSLRNIWFSNMRWGIPNNIMLGLLGLLMASVFLFNGLIGVTLFFVPLLLARFIFKSYVDMHEVYMNTLSALAGALDAKDAYTRGHSERVSEYSTLIASAMGMKEDQVEVIRHLALLHDVGKIGVSDEVLCKPDKLSDEEFDIIKLHSAVGAKIIDSINILGENKELILHHHERYSGGGYPAGISGEDIPLGSRIISVADAFDAMTSDRSYRPRRSFEEAFEVLKEMSGSQFDPIVVQAFLDVIQKETIISKGCESIVSVK